VACYILLDSGPLWLACFAPGFNPAATACDSWLVALQVAGARIIIPAIADDETRRVLRSRGAQARLRRLDAMRARYGFLDVSRAALDRAAELWADVRSQGIPTAHPEALDVDCIVAGQALTAFGPGDTATIATRNAGHFGRFPGVDARDWPTIT
jgi:predicted nucleic acid-binding protein